MSFTRVNPGGWAVGASFTSAQANQIDTNVSNSLDKTVAGDTLSGVVTMAATAQINVASAGARVQASVASGILAAVVGGMNSGTTSGFALTGGAGDWPTFGVGGASPRGRVVTQAIVPTNMVGGWTTIDGLSFGHTYLIGPATTAKQPIQLTALHNGATLAQVIVLLSVTSHSNVPANLPNLSVFRYPITVGSAFGSQALASSDPQPFTPTPGSGSLWTASGNVQALTYTTSQNNVIDTSSYVYGISLQDENGTNSVAGNVYIAIQLVYSHITSMQFP